ncbi:MAG: hypothetical protein WC408_06445 [Candidatus Micrarchaeia archaeon]|jgi:hypothetical protein
MVNVTLSVPAELHAKMKKHPKFKWSRIASDAFEKEINKSMLLDEMDELLKNSTLTEEDAERIGHEIKLEMRKRFDRKYGSKKL